MSCCTSPGEPAGAPTPQAPMLAGWAGFTKLYYVGTSPGTLQWVGAVTGVTYLFGGSRTEGYVDPGDAPALLATGSFSDSPSIPEPLGAPAEPRRRGAKRA